MARWWNVGKDGTVFINCLKPAKNLLLKAKSAPPHVKVIITIAAFAVGAGGIGYYIYKKTVSFREKKSYFGCGDGEKEESRFIYPH